MNRSHFFFVFISFLAVAGCKESPSPPNVLFIMMDDLGYGQFGIHNNDLTTEGFDPFFVEIVREEQGYDLKQALDFSRRAMPVMHRLAEEGIVFTKAFTSSSLCAPSRLGIATGILQARMGIYRNVDCENEGIKPNMHLAEIIKRQGYATAHIGKWHVGRRDDQMIIDALRSQGITDTLSWRQVARSHPDIYDQLWDAGYYGSVIEEQNPLQHGFDYYFGYNNWASQFYNSPLVWENYEHAGTQKGYNTDVFTDTALAFISKQLDTEKPFYVQLHYHAVHDSLEPKAPAHYFNKFRSNSYDLANFYAHVNAVDENIGRIIDLLKDRGAYENTLIVFTSDNGAQAGGPSVLPGNAPFSGHKGTYYQGGIRVPYVIHWPSGIKKPRSSDMLVSTMDILPTAIEAANGTVPDGLDGKSLLQTISGEEDEPVHDHLVWAGLHARAWGFLLKKSYETDGSERNFAPPAWVVLKDDNLLRYTGTIDTDLYTDYPDGAEPILELFNIQNDPAELTDVSKEFPAKVDELVDIYRRESSDFLPAIFWRKSKWEELQLSLQLN